jgi:type II secretory pathway pseudopilin PulG
VTTVRRVTAQLSGFFEPVTHDVQTVPWSATMATMDRRGFSIVEGVVSVAIAALLIVGALGAFGSVVRHTRTEEPRSYAQMRTTDLQTDLQASARYGAASGIRFANGGYTFTPEPIPTPSGFRGLGTIEAPTTVSVTMSDMNGVPNAIVYYGPTPTPAPNGYTGPPYVPQNSFAVPIYQSAPTPTCQPALQQAGDC